uniref:Uncharacterized protein n=1 Tax=Lotus japonicus TaxID=34305 RepID=I3SDR9_LOTJA|nr:unknown [Lotus japonicus]
MKLIGLNETPNQHTCRAHLCKLLNIQDRWLGLVRTPIRVDNDSCHIRAYIYSFFALLFF